MALHPSSNRSVLREQHRRRIRGLLIRGSAVGGLVCLIWAIVFALYGTFAQAMLELPGVVFAAATAWLAHRGRLRAASRLAIGSLYLVVTVLTVLFDMPSDQVPRSSHNFLLALGVFSGPLLRGECTIVRMGAPILCYGTFVVLAATQWGPTPALSLPDSVRLSALWINPTGSVVLLLVALHVTQTDVAARRSLEAELRDALLHDGLVLHYQPQVGRDGAIFGAEALARWKHPTRGVIPPGEFIPMAERCGLMVPLGDWVIRSACAQLAVWQEHPSTASWVLAVNVSATQFAQPDFVDRVLDRVREAGVDPARLKFELTEGMLADDLVDMAAKMKQLKSLGIGLSLDDFGTGFSSLSYLRSLPLDQLKIDQSFVRNILGSSGDRAIAQTVIALGHTLGLMVIAEGVETAEQQHCLAAMGCDAFQGYLFSPPVPAAQLETMVSLQHEFVAANDPCLEPGLFEAPPIR